MSRPAPILRPCVAALTLLALLTGPALGQQAPKQTAVNIDVVLCLDVSGSMEGLINSAKVKLWDIVNDLGKIKPTPNLRVGLYSYGHQSYSRESGWVRKEADLTTDLDLVYKKLNGLTIHGGTELVARVTRDALEQQKWSADKKSLKMIFVCGNEPVNQDRQVSLKDVSRKAVEKDVIVNTIYCAWTGAAPGEADGWKEFARTAEGRYAVIDQQRGAVAINTPHDKKLTELSSQLNSTYIAYGAPVERSARVADQKAQDANAEKAGGGAAAGRAMTKGGGLYRNSAWDLVDKLKEDPKFDVTKVAEKDLPEELKKLKPAERDKYVKDMLNKRRMIQNEIDELGKKRAAYVADYLKKNKNKGDQAFDEAVRGTLRDQAKNKGIKIPD